MNVGQRTLDAVCIQIWGERVWADLPPMAKSTARENVKPVLAAVLQLGADNGWTWARNDA